MTPHTYLLLLAFLHTLLADVRCFYDNETVLIYGRNGSAVLQLWPLDAGRNSICTSLSSDSTLEMTSLYYSISASVPTLNLSEPVNISFPCPDTNTCENFVRTANSLSYTLKTAQSSNIATVKGSVKSLVRYNFVYQECWSGASILYNIFPSHPSIGVCAAVTPVRCRAPSESLNKVTAELQIIVNDTSYTLPIHPETGAKASGGFSLPFDHLKTNYYCYLCNQTGTSANDMATCREVATQLHSNANFDATLLVNIPYANVVTGIAAPIRYSTSIATKRSIYYANCFKGTVGSVLWDRMSVLLETDQTVPSNCTTPQNVDRVHYDLKLLVAAMDGKTSMLHFNHKVGNFGWKQNRYWFLCNSNQTCLDILHDAYTNSLNLTGYFMIEFIAENNTTIDGVTLAVNPAYNCLRTAEIFVTSSEIRVLVMFQERYCRDLYPELAKTQTYTLQIYENLLTDLEYMSIRTFARFKQNITNWNMSKGLVFTCNTYDATFSETLCADAFSKLYKLVRAKKIITTLYLGNFSTAIGKAYRNNYVPLIGLAVSLCAVTLLAGSLYVALTVQKHRQIVKLLHSEAQPACGS